MSTLQGGGNIVTDGLVFYLDAANTKSYIGSGTTWTDLSRGGNNGTLVNMDSTGFSSSNGGVIVFDGTNDYVIHNSLDLGTIASWSIWVKYTSFSGVPVLLGSNVNNYYSLYYLNSSKIFYVGYGSTFPSLVYSTGLTIGQWYNITLTRNGLTITIYINGVSIGTMSGGSSTLSSIFSIIGAETSARYYSNINLSQVIIYNRVLNSQEVLQNYNTTKSRFGL